MNRSVMLNLHYTVRLKKRYVEPTLHIKMNRSVDHPHFILSNAGQPKVVVLSADIDQSQVDCMNGVAQNRLEQTKTWQN